jgi:hypothetical protein
MSPRAPGQGWPPPREATNIAPDQGESGCSLPYTSSVSFMGTTPIGGPLVGFVAGALGARAGLGFGAAAAVAAGAFGLVVFGGRRLAAQAPSDAAQAPVAGAPGSPGPSGAAVTPAPSGAGS